MCVSIILLCLSSAVALNAVYVLFRVFVALLYKVLSLKASPSTSVSPDILEAVALVAAVFPKIALH